MSEMTRIPVGSIDSFVRSLFKTKGFIPLHEPTFRGNEKKYVNEAIDSTFVSSVGGFVDDFEKKIEEFTGASRAVATVNGTAALHTAFFMSGIKRGDLVITQALTFVATCNALRHIGAEPIFCDVSRVSLGLCPIAVEKYLTANADIVDGHCVHTVTGQRIRAVIPMHTYGHPAQLDELQQICEKWSLTLIEDAAESLGSLYKGRHTGTLGDYGVLSFNGNKVITTGGGGMVLCRSIDSGLRAKHITTTAKIPHPYEFVHDEAGFNYRLPNLNAALGCGQMEVLTRVLANKRALAKQYRDFFSESDVQFCEEPSYATSNYWLNTIICPNKNYRDQLLTTSNSNGVMTRPTWRLMSRLPMYESKLHGDMTESIYLEERLVNLPSSSSEAYL